MFQRVKEYTSKHGQILFRKGDGEDGSDDVGTGDEGWVRDWRNTCMILIL